MGSPTMAARPSSAISPIESRFSPEKDNFELGDCRAHVVRKANYKAAGNGQFIKTSWSNRLKVLVEGNTAEARYHRAAYEGSQRVSASLFSEQYKSDVEGRPVDAANSTLVRSRFYRQDNLRFNPQLMKPEFGLSEQDKRAVKYSRWAHRANGVTELGAAPTGLLVKSSKIAFQPKHKDHAFKSQLRVLAVLPFATLLVSFFARGVFTEAMGRAFSTVAEVAQTHIRAVVCSFSAVAATSAMLSLAFGARSAMVATRSPLSDAIVDTINFNKDKHLHRIFLLLKDVKDKPGAVHLLTTALNKKIGAAYRTDSATRATAAGTPILLNRLLTAINGAQNNTEMKQAIAKTIGSYLTEVSAAGDSQGRFLDPESDKSELLTRENHFLALTNLIEHHAMGPSGHKYYMDVRHQVENTVAKGRTGFVKMWNAAKESLAIADNANSKYRSKNLRYDSRNILNNPHQYGPLTRGLAQFSEALRIFNHGVVLSLNYQVTRPVAKLAGYITESALKRPNSRVTSFSIGRVFASCFWAVGEGCILIPLATGGGIAFSGAGAGPTKLPFPLQMPISKRAHLGIGINSTALQMLVVAIPAAILMGAAKGACYLEGWNGNVARRLEPADSRRNPVSW